MNTGLESKFCFSLKSCCCMAAAVALCALALLLSGLFIESGLRNFRSFDRFVTVKGLAEREVEANLATWTLQHAVTGKDLGALQTEMEDKNEKIVTFLTRHGLEAAEIEKQPLQLQDLLAQSYRPENIGENRYIITAGFRIRTPKIDKIDQAVGDMGSLIRMGVSIGNSQPPTYIFTQLNDIKPEMIAEATKAARASAQKFAADSGQKVGAIRNASQGLFQILPLDQGTSEYMSADNQKRKLIRVVSTIDFYLE